MKKTFLTLFLAAIATLPTALSAADPEPFTINGIIFKPGAAWTSKTPSNPMRAAELEITPDGASAPLTAVFYFFGSGQGGSADANVQRWIGQFETVDSKDSKEHEFDGKTVTVLEVKGTFLESKGGPFSGTKTPRPNHALLSAVVPGTDANIFVKLTGPQKDVAAIKDQFITLVTSPFKE